jgi:hypothetical protein
MSAGRYILSIASSLPRRASVRSARRTAAAPAFHSFVTFLTVFLFFGLGTLMLVVLIVQTALFPAGYPDPFTSFEAIMPGRSFTGIPEFYSCERQLLAPVFDQEPMFDSSLGQSTCVITPVSETFDRVIVIGQESRIQQVQFLPTNLQAIELLRRWGRPDLIQPSWDGYSLIWNVGVVARVPAGRQFSYLLPVRGVLLRSGI